jgi:ABC-type multidrug transport system permease subunit
VSADAISDLTQIGLILLLVAFAAFVVSLATGGRLDWWLERTGSTCLLVLGLLVFLCLPVVGTLAAVGAVMIKVNRFLTKRGKVNSPFAAID